MLRRQTKKYYFSVEGETEKWYLEWLQKEINDTTQAMYSIKFDIKIEKNPLARVKAMNPLEKTVITHVFDIESENDIQKCKNTLECMIKAEKIGKKVKYDLGYSNLTFELWIILHKLDCNSSKTNCKHYLSELNKAYNENFEDLREYKEEKNFEQILKKVTLDDVINAVKRAEQIMQKNKENHTPKRHGKHEFYIENPSLSLEEVIGDILKDCGII